MSPTSKRKVILPKHSGVAAPASPSAALRETALGLQTAELDAVIAAIRQPVIAALVCAADRLSPLTAADLNALERIARLKLDALRAGLRAQHTAEMRRLAEDRARWMDLDIPQAMRRSVHQTRSATHETLP